METKMWGAEGQAIHLISYHHLHETELQGEASPVRARALLASLRIRQCRLRWPTTHLFLKQLLK